MKRKIKVFIFCEVLIGVFINYISIILFHVLKQIKSEQSVVLKSGVFNAIEIIQSNYNNDFLIKLLVLCNIMVFVVAFYFTFVYEGNGKIMRTGMIKITDKIQIPVSAGNGQYGNAHFMSLNELSKLKEICTFEYDGNNSLNPKKGGLVIGIKAIGDIPKKGNKERNKEKILYVGADRHALLVGATRSGKSRRMILESIWLTILAGENIVVTDPKGELWAYTHKFAKEHDYLEVTIDFREPNKCAHYNYMQDILDALEKKDTAEAIDLTWDLVSVLVGEAKGEPIWHNGECAAIAAVILIVAMEAPEEYRNLTNVYYFLFNMAKPDEMGEMPISRFLEDLPETHPARAVFAMAEIAHVKTRGSFFSSALGTLRHFTNPKIAEMTSKTDYNFKTMAHEKTIVYIILPDEKTTLYSLGSMYIMQHYIYNVKEANNNGGRCPIDWWYFLDEFGQLPYIPPIPQFLSVGAGRGMRFVLALQDFQQLQKKYKEDYNTIKNNCDCWIYLKCSNEDTQKEFSSRCGNYTIQVNSTSVSQNKNNSFSDSGNYSASLTGRALLLPDEVGLIESPYSLISFAGNFPIMSISPDLSYYRANKELGLGDEEHNKKIIIERNRERSERLIEEIKLWGIWNEYKILDDEYDFDSSDSEEDYEKISFLDLD